MHHFVKIYIKDKSNYVAKAYFDNNILEIMTNL